MVEWKSKTFSASGREPETNLRCYCKGVAKGAQEEETFAHFGQSPAFPGHISVCKDAS